MSVFDGAVFFTLTFIWVAVVFLTKRVNAQERRIRDLENRK
jgi:hypothetical protein